MDVLKNKQYKSYEKLSRYTTFPYYYHTVDGKYIYGTTSQLSKDSDYSLYLVQRGDTWDSIALDAYNNPVYYWVLCDYNEVQDPFTEPVEGTYIRVPVISVIKYDEVL